MRALTALAVTLVASDCKPTEQKRTTSLEASLRAAHRKHLVTAGPTPGACAPTQLDKRCVHTEDCQFVDVLLDECQTTVHVGVSTQGRREFDALEKEDVCGGGVCPSCVVRWMVAEDCASSIQPDVACVSGRCLTASRTAEEP